jgi:transketolase
MRDRFIERLTELAERDERVMIITGDLGFGVLDAFAKRFPRQFLNAGVAEQNMTGLATGLALEGRTVFTYSIANFSTLRCLEQLRNDACYHDANVKAVAVGGGFSYGALGISHHATEDLSILRALPSMVVVSPGDDWEALEATEALAKRPGAGYLRLDKSSAGRTERPGERFELGKARRLREGSDLTLLATGGILGEVLEAVETLGREGIRCRATSVHTIKPLDLEEIEAAARETGGVVTVEEQTVEGGLGGAVAEALLEGPVRPEIFYRMGLREGFSSAVGSQAYLRRRYGLDAPAIVGQVKRLLRSRS